MATRTVVTTILPYGDSSFNWNSAQAGDWGGCDQGYLQTGGGSSSVTYYALGIFVPNEIGGNAVTINRVTGVFYSTHTHTSTDTYVRLSYNNSDRIDNPNGGNTSLSSTSITSLGTNTYKCEFTPNHSIPDNSYTYSVEFACTLTYSDVYFQGIQVEWTYTIPTSYPYSVYHSLPPSVDYSVAIDSAGSSWGQMNIRYYKIYSGQLIYWDLSKLVPTDVDGHTVTLNEVEVWLWINDTKNGTFSVTGYDIGRINDSAPSSSFTSSSSTWTLLSGASYTYKILLSPNHTMANNETCVAKFTGQTYVSSTPRIQGGRIKYTVNA